MIFDRETPTDGQVLAVTNFSTVKTDVTDFGLNGLSIVGGVDKSSSQFNNSGIKPKNSVKTDYSFYYIGGAISLILLLFIILIARKV